MVLSPAGGSAWGGIEAGSDALARSFDLPKP
jgi:hypothetical protein